MKTPFELAQEQVANGDLKTPSVSMGNSEIDYFGYQLTVHRFNLRILAGGMKMKNVKISDLKKYYGLKGSANDCLIQFEAIVTKYKEKLELKRMGESAN